jgi:hypothetical protein
VVALRREVLGAQPVERPLGVVLQQQRDDQRGDQRCPQTIARAPLPRTVTPPSLTW